MNMKSLTSSLIMGMMLVPLYAGAQNIKVHGTVIAESDGEPLPGVTEEVKKETKPRRRRRGYSEYSLDDHTAMRDKVIGEEE